MTHSLKTAERFYHTVFMYFSIVGGPKDQSNTFISEQKAKQKARKLPGPGEYNLNKLFNYTYYIRGTEGIFYFISMDITDTLFVFTLQAAPFLGFSKTVQCPTRACKLYIIDNIDNLCCILQCTFINTSVDHLDLISRSLKSPKLPRKFSYLFVVVFFPQNVCCFEAFCFCCSAVK